MRACICFVNAINHVMFESVLMHDKQDHALDGVRVVLTARCEILNWSVFRHKTCTSSTCGRATGYGVNCVNCINCVNNQYNAYWTS